METPKCWLGLLFVVLLLAAGTRDVRAAACRDFEGRDDGHMLTVVNNSGEQVTLGVFGSRFGLNDERLIDDRGYSHPLNWVLDAKQGSSLSWCVPSHFNGRFFARTSCSNGSCLTGNCCKEGSDCSGNICTKAPDPTTLAEAFVDAVKNKVNTTYFDISFVDGYDFPLLLKPQIPVRHALNNQGSSSAPYHLDASNGSYDFTFNADLAANVVISNYSDDNISIANATKADLDSAGAVSSSPVSGDVTITYKAGTLVLAGVAKGKTITSVDAFNNLGIGVIFFPSSSSLVNSSGCSVEAGCKQPPRCQWGYLVDGVCWGPYKMFEAIYPDYRYRPGYYPLAAMCAQNKFIDELGVPACCGCGKSAECTLGACPTETTITNPFTGKPVTLKASGCSPINYSYPHGSLERQQITCNPTCDYSNPSNDCTHITFYQDLKSPDQTNGIIDEKVTCNSWDPAFRQYTRAIINACGPDKQGKSQKSVYTWQYDDDHGLFSCGNDYAMGFTLTINPRDHVTPSKSLITFTPGAGVSGTMTVNQDSPNAKQFVGPDPLLLPVATGDKVSIRYKQSYCAAGFSVTCNLTYQGKGTGFVVDTATSAPICADTATFKDWGKQQISLAAPATSWCSNDDKNSFKLQVAPSRNGSGNLYLVGHLCINKELTSFSPASNPPDPLYVYLHDKDVLRLQQQCDPGKDGKARIISCIVDFGLVNGTAKLTPRTVNGAAKLCTDGRINWNTVISTKNLGISWWDPNADCVSGTYAASCPDLYTAQDAKAALQIHNQKLPANHTDPQKLDQNQDNQINLIDAINILRRSVGH